MAQLESFWDFSLRIYAKPGVEAACLALQDREGLDVNLVLYCLWLGASGRGTLQRPELAAADRAVAVWRDDVIRPLRRERRRLAEEIPNPPPLFAILRKRIAEIELAAEEVAQSILESRAAPALSSPDRAAAEANLALYCKNGAAEQALLLQAAFPS